MGAKNNKEPVIKKQCPKCESHYDPVAGFYTADEHIFPSGRFHLCKSCVEEIIDKQGHKGFMTLLRVMNKPFFEKLYKGDYKKYLTQIASLSQYKGKTFEDSEFDGDNSSSYHNDTDSENIKELIEFWGKGFSDDEYLLLQNEYHKLLNAYECDSYAMELLFQEASHQRLTIKRLREAGKSVEKELKTLQDLLGSANIKPVQETGANASEQATFGTLIKKYENERPIPEPDEAWKDVDGIQKYMKVWFFGHFAKMLGMKNDVSSMYEEEVSEYKVEAPEYQEDEGVL